MHKYLIAGVMASMLMAGPASAATITDMAKCKSEIEIVKEMDANTDLGAKYDAIVKDLIGVLEELCNTESFEPADDIAAIVRGMLATE